MQENCFLLLRRFQLKWRFGARTACLVAQCAARFASCISLTRDGKQVKAKSRLGLLMLGSMDPGTAVDVAVFGPDAYEAMQAFTELFTCGPAQSHCPHQECHSAPMLVGYGGGRAYYACSDEKRHCWEVIGESNALILTDLETDTSPAPFLHLN